MIMKVISCNILYGYISYLIMIFYVMLKGLYLLWILLTKRKYF